MTYVACKLARSEVLNRDDVLLIDGCDDFLNYIIFDSVYFVENSDVLVV